MAQLHLLEALLALESLCKVVRLYLWSRHINDILVMKPDNGASTYQRCPCMQPTHRKWCGYPDEYAFWWGPVAFLSFDCEQRPGSTSCWSARNPRKPRFLYDGVHADTLAWSSSFCQSQLLPDLRSHRRRQSQSIQQKNSSLVNDCS